MEKKNKLPGVAQVDKKKTDDSALDLLNDSKTNKYASAEFDNDTGI